jgi:hypothetical protein
MGLALRLGKTVGEILDNHTAREIAEWQAFFQLEERDLRKAALATKAQQGVAAQKARRRNR